MKIERVSYKNFYNRLKTIETKNLKKTGSSLTWVSLESYFYPSILSINSDDEILIIDREKYDEIRKQVLK